MAEIVYLLCGVTSLFCAFLLVRSYRVQRTRLLLWSSLCFVGLAANNAILVVDLMVVPSIDLSLARTIVAFAAVLALLGGLIWESK
ncbi:MAG: DUF5985 family protein [Kofleriaceae bacterium]